MKCRENSDLSLSDLFNEVQGKDGFFSLEFDGLTDGSD